ncbi:hypothetical protein Pr1d_25940 [Bythopirellula goksoeyrii]|uniref:Uncharacterized protein n=1 Tax=Bythopirellula goksoeyrii TaxID=1400387 RepID=A0A5B9Q8Q9_9BACT|nr:hypothetical protein Pr1d_25940 [Bythopirellula goksoeyrii]
MLQLVYLLRLTRITTTRAGKGFENKTLDQSAFPNPWTYTAPTRFSEQTRLFGSANMCKSS